MKSLEPIPESPETTPAQKRTRNPPIRKKRSLKRRLIRFGAVLLGLILGWWAAGFLG